VIITHLLADTTLVDRLVELSIPQQDRTEGERR